MVAIIGEELGFGALFFYPFMTVQTQQFFTNLLLIELVLDHQQGCSDVFRKHINIPAPRLEGLLWGSCVKHLFVL